MKINYLSLSVLLLCGTLFATSCGGSEEKDKKNPTENAENETANENQEADVVEDSEFAHLGSAEDAMNEYTNLLEQYAALMSAGDLSQAKDLKKQLDALEKYAKLEYGSASALKSMTDLTRLALDIESGKITDLSDFESAVGVLGSAMDAVKDMPGVDANTKKAMQASEDLMKSAGNMSKDPMKAAEEMMKAAEEMQKIKY